MSRIGRKKIAVPSGVDVDCGKGVVRVRGPKGSVFLSLHDGINAKLDDGAVHIGRDNDLKQTRAFHGLDRALVSNAMLGVSDGWTKQLDIIGIGYRAERSGDTVTFNLGYSHPIEFPVPEDVDIQIDSKANRITVTGIDRQRVGQIAADIRKLRAPEPYKGKGVRYVGEYIRIKAGKQGA